MQLYDFKKKVTNENEIKEIEINEIKNEKIDGINVKRIPFKKSVLPFLDQLTP